MHYLSKTEITTTVKDTRTKSQNFVLDHLFIMIVMMFSVFRGEFPLDQSIYLNDNREMS